MSGWQQAAGSGENDPLKLAETGERQQWSFHGHVFDFECKAEPHKYPLIPNGVQFEARIAEVGGGDAHGRPIECTEVATQGGGGAELLSDFDVWARLSAEEKVREIFAYAGKRVLAQEELAPPAAEEAAAEA
jgi:hypothetical protein